MITQCLDLAVLRRRWNPERNKMKNVTMREMTAGCVAFENAPLQATQVQPKEEKKNN